MGERLEPDLRANAADMADDREATPDQIMRNWIEARNALGEARRVHDVAARAASTARIQVERAGRAEVAAWDQLERLRANAEPRGAS